MGLLFGGANQLSMVCSLRLQPYGTKIQQITSFALYNLCKHPEYLGPLREEAAAAKRNKDQPFDHNQMYLMDSFLRETGRLNPTTICES